MTQFKSFLCQYIYSFIRYRQASEHWNEASYEINLKLFDRYCFNCNPDTSATLTQDMIDGWCKQRDLETNNSCRSRIYVVVSFIKFLQERNLTTMIPPTLPRKEPRIYIPHAFSYEELERFFHKCDNISVRKNMLQDECRRLTVPVFFRLLYSSGIRTYEARLLEVHHVNLIDGVINIKYSKGHKQHYIILHDSMLDLMRKYNDAIAELIPNRTYFFPSRDGTHYKKGWVTKTFRQMWDSVNDSHATAYEFRHHYAVVNINQWIDEGFNFDDKLLYLSKSMGHTTIESTKYYYSLVPGLADILKQQTQNGFDWIVPEVPNDEEI